MHTKMTGPERLDLKTSNEMLDEAAARIRPFTEQSVDSFAGDEEVEGQKADAGKDRWDLLPWRPIRGLVKVITFGARKYAHLPPDNWRRVPDGRERYFAAACRHIVALRLGERYDPESGLHHGYHALCDLVFFCVLDDAE